MNYKAMARRNGWWIIFYTWITVVLSFLKEYLKGNFDEWWVGVSVFFIWLGIVYSFFLGFVCSLIWAWCQWKLAGSENESNDKDSSD